MAEWHGQPVCDLMDSVTDMADTAAIIASLDLVISVDTSVLHLAGALGKPVWLLSRWDACWRWLDSGETTAWYPTMRIFRPQERSFAPVLRQMGEALQTWVATWHATTPRPRRTGDTRGESKGPANGTASTNPRHKVAQRHDRGRAVGGQTGPVAEPHPRS